MRSFRLLSLCSSVQSWHATKKKPKAATCCWWPFSARVQAMHAGASIGRKEMSFLSPLAVGGMPSSSSQKRIRHPWVPVRCCPCQSRVWTISDQTFQGSLVFLVCWRWHCTHCRRLGHLWSCDQMKVSCLTVSADVVTSCFSRNQTNALLTFRGGAFSAALCLYLSLEKDFLVSQLSKSTSGLGCKERSGGHACPSGGSTGQAVVSWHPSTPHRTRAPGGRGLPPAPKETRRAADPGGLWNQAMRMGRSCSRWQECWWGWCTWKALPLTFALTLWKDAAWSLHQPLVSAVPPSLWWAAAVFLQWSPPAEGRGGTANPLGCTWMSSKRRRLRFSRLNVFFLNAMSALGSYMDTFASACTPVSCLSRAWTREGFAFEWFPFSSQASAAAKLCLWPGSQMLQPWNLPLNIIYTFFSFCRFLHEFNSPHSHYNLVSVHDWIGPRLMPIYSSSG